MLFVIHYFFTNAIIFYTHNDILKDNVFGKNELNLMFYL